VYPSDEALPALGLHGALVFTTRCSVVLNGFDFTEALAVTGVVSILTYADIPKEGKNTIGQSLYLFVPVGEIVPYVGAAIAVVIATTEAAANFATSLVRVNYNETSDSPIVNLEQAIAKKSFFKIPAHIPQVTNIKAGDPDKYMKSAFKTVKGHINAGGQYHFYMEAQSAIANIVDGEFVDVTCGTQNLQGNQSNIAEVLGIPMNKVSLYLFFLLQLRSLLMS
jgi:xanthine dehydrogenase large subunit